MFASVFLAALLTQVALVRGDPTPTTPSPGAVYNEGSNCEVAWNADTEGVWKVMNIELMTGNNVQMTFLETVGTVDGTDANNASYSYPCPNVNPNSPIYFYQFTSPFSKSVYWTGRFAIADSDGKTTPATESTVYNGQNVSWGSGSIVGQTDSGSAPAYGESASGSASSAPATTLSFSPAVSTSADSSGTVVSSAPGLSETGGPDSVASTSAPTGIVTRSSGTDSAGVGSATSAAGGAGAAANAAPGALKVDKHVFRAGVALCVAALTFAVAF